MKLFVYWNTWLFPRTVGPSKCTQITHRLANKTADKWCLPGWQRDAPGTFFLSASPSCCCLGAAAPGTHLNMFGPDPWRENKTVSWIVSRKDKKLTISVIILSKYILLKLTWDKTRWQSRAELLLETQGLKYLTRIYGSHTLCHTIAHHCVWAMA